MPLSSILTQVLIVSAFANARADEDSNPTFRSLNTAGYQCRHPCTRREGSGHPYFACEFPGKDTKYCSPRENHGIHGRPCSEETPCDFYKNTRLHPNQPSCMTVDNEEDQCALKDAQDGPIMIGARYGYCTSACEFTSGTINDWPYKMCWSTHPYEQEYCSDRDGKDIFGYSCYAQCGFVPTVKEMMVCKHRYIGADWFCGYAGAVFTLTDEQLAPPPPFDDRKMLPYAEEDTDEGDLNPKWRSLDTDGYQCKFPCSLKEGYDPAGKYYYYFSCERPGEEVKYCSPKENHGVHGWPCLEETPCDFYKYTKFNPDQPSCITVEKQEDQCAQKDPQDGPIMTGAKNSYCTSPCGFKGDTFKQCESTHPDGWDYCSDRKGADVEGWKCKTKCGSEETGSTMTCSRYDDAIQLCGYAGELFTATDERQAFPPPPEDRKAWPLKTAQDLYLNVCP